MVTLITGASTGIGAEFARQFAALGHDLVVVARSADRLEELAAALRAAHGVNVTVIGMDLSRPDAAEQLWRRTTGLGLEVDVLVNNAGVGTHADVADADPRRLEEEVELNCRTLVGTTARYLPAMRARGAGAVVNVASTAAFQPLPRWPSIRRRRPSCCPSPRRCGRRSAATASACWRSARGSPTPRSSELAGEGATAASGPLAQAFTRTPQQVVGHTIRALSGHKSSFVDGTANAVVIRRLNRLLPRRLVVALAGRLIHG